MNFCTIVWASSLKDVEEELEDEGIDFREDIPVGMMIEVPSAALMASNFAKEVNFFSIGTNDLIQYTLAVDRTNARVAGHYDSLHPSVLRAIDYAVGRARDLGKPLSVCGEMAGAPASAVLLIGMGVEALSMASPSLPRVKQAIRTFTRQQARELSTEALRTEDAAAVHRILIDAFDRVGLSSLLTPRVSRA
jgi:phosphoenolpyruvate-protein kinase (PTS system EI component)